MGQNILEFIRKVEPLDDYIIHTALWYCGQNRIVGLTMTMTRMECLSHGLNKWEIWEAPIKLLDDLKDLHKLICQFEDARVDLPCLIKTSWDKLAERVGGDACLPDGRELRGYLREQVSNLQCGPDTEWQRFEFSCFRTVILKPFHDRVMHEALMEHWEHSMAVFLSILDDMEVEGYEGWDNPESWADIRHMLEDLRALQDAFFRFDGTIVGIPSDADGLENARCTLKAITENDVGRTHRTVLLNCWGMLCARAQCLV